MSKRVTGLIIVCTIFLCGVIYGAMQYPYAWAGEEETSTPMLIETTPEVVVFNIITTPTPVPATPPPGYTIPPTPSPKPLVFPIDEIRDLEYPDEDARCLARALGSIAPKEAIETSEIALCEMIQNMVDTGRYKDTIRYTLLMKSEFFGYDPSFDRSDEHNRVADYAMRTWYEVKLYGDSSHRIVPTSGIHYRFINKKYIEIYDTEWNVVFTNVPEGAQ